MEGKLKNLLLLCVSLTSLIGLSQDRPVTHRCGTPDRDARLARFGSVPSLNGADCSSTLTNPLAQYDPNQVYEIPVVVHIITDSAGTTGVISDNMVHSQIEILNEDFLALPDSNGAPGTYTGIRFYLATEDPSGNPTTGITRSANTTWFNDGGSYYNTLNWDPSRYLNIYTNNAGGNLGYVPALPADGNGFIVGTPEDRVVILWNTFGRNAPFSPYNLGRTATHEVGHYLGLEHTFSGGCSASTAPGCYSGGDLICDTLPESNPNFGDCSGANPNTCGNSDPIHNYMDYSDDLCMWEFSPEQMRRMRCSLESWRTDLYSVATNCANSTLEADAGNDVSTCEGVGVVLTASGVAGAGGYSYQWSPADGLDNPTSATPTATPGTTTIYTVTVTDSASCEAVDEVTVQVVAADGGRFVAWQNPAGYSPDYDLDGNGLVNLFDLLAILEACL
jgi:Pregnancy-associated plasma protein-A